MINKNEISGRTDLFDSLVRRLTCGKYRVKTFYRIHSFPKAQLGLLEIPDFIDGDIAGYNIPQRRIIKCDQSQQ